MWGGVPRVAALPCAPAIPPRAQESLRQTIPPFRATVKDDKSGIGHIGRFGRLLHLTDCPLADRLLVALRLAEHVRHWHRIDGATGPSLDLVGAREKADHGLEHHGDGLASTGCAHFVPLSFVLMLVHVRRHW